MIKNGVSVAIIGKPNSGKSTLLNSLLNENRAIVSAIPGTTRDTIEELINIDGIIFRLIDTAGIRQQSTDVIEKAGMERSLEKMKQADLVLYLFDAAEGKAVIQTQKLEFERQQLNYLLVANKIDEVGEQFARDKFGDMGKVIFISAKQHLYTDVLKERMVDTVLQGRVQAENTIITNARHFHALKEVQKSLADIKEGLDNKLPGDLLALDIRHCLHYLGK